MCMSGAWGNWLIPGLHYYCCYGRCLWLLTPDFVIASYTGFIYRSLVEIIRAHANYVLLREQIQHSWRVQVKHTLIGHDSRGLVRVLVSMPTSEVFILFVMTPAYLRPLQRQLSFVRLVLLARIVLSRDWMDEQSMGNLQTCIGVIWTGLWWLWGWLGQYVQWCVMHRRRIFLRSRNVQKVCHFFKHLLPCSVSLEYFPTLASALYWTIVAHMPIVKL